MIKYIFPLMLLAISARGQVQNNNGQTQPNGNTGNTINDTTTYQVAKGAVSALLIDPGKGIGKIKLNTDATKLTVVLGKPDKQDAGMGGTMMTWFAGHDAAKNSLTIYARRQMGSKDETVARVKQIRITSPEFKTIDSVGVGSRLAEIKKHYNVRTRQSVIATSTVSQVWADRIRGIAFEIDPSGICTAVRVHEAYDKAAASINMRAD